MNKDLSVIVKESGLEPTKANYILEKFQDYFKIAAEWDQKARAIKVTSADQTAEMEMARTGRLFLREKRIAVEKARKELKEQALREGKAIDGIANVLKALIEPIEEYLDNQEHYVELKVKAEEEERMRQEAKRIEQERIAAEEAAAKEQERIRRENDKLRDEAIKREAAAKVEREKQEALLAKERAANEKARLAAEEKSRKEREAIEAKAAAERRKIEEKNRIAAEKAAKEKAKVEAELEKKKMAEQKALDEKKRLEKELKSMITCPHCQKKFKLPQV